MKTRLTLIGTMAVACAAIQLTAMPTEEETRRAEPDVKERLSQERTAFESGKKTRSEVAAAAMKFANEADTDAEKLLLMKGAFVLYVQDGNLKEAAETMKALKAAISDMPPQSVKNIIETALPGASKKGERAKLYTLLGEAKAESTTEKTRKDIAKLFPGWSLDSEVPQENRKEWASGFCANHRGQDSVLRLHPVNRETPIVLSRTVTLSKGNPCLFLKTASFDKDSDFLLSVLVNGKEVLPKRLIRTPDCAPWQDITVPLSAWRGSKVKIEVVLTANDWWLEHPFFKRLEVAEGTGREKFDPEAKKSYGGYTWSYRVDNDEATIVAEKDGKYSCAVSPMPEGNVSIPATLNGVKVTSIGRDAFKKCIGLTSVTIPEGVTYIDSGAFCDCVGLTSVTIPEGVEGLGWHVFRRCNGLTSVTIPSSMRNIHGSAFIDIEALTSFQVESGNRFYKSENGLLITKDGTTLVHGVNGDVTIPSSVTTIGLCAFEGCSALRSVSIPSGVKNIDAYAFKNCRGVSDIALPLGVTNIGYQAFWGCGLTSVTIPYGVTNIGEGAFLHCANLSSVTFPSSLQDIGRYAFALCSGLKAVTLPDGLTKIGANAFMWCSGLKSIEIPSGVKDIGNNAFERCVNLESVTFRGEVPNGFKDGFKDCGKLKSIHVPANAKSWEGMKEWQGIPLAFDAEVAESRLDQSRYMIVDLDKSGKDAVSYLDDVPNGGWSDEYRTKKIVFRRISPGSFEYLPGKSFKITKPFYIGVFEVTQKQYEMMMKENPSEFKGDMRPVEKVSYIDIRGANKGLNWPQDNLVDDDSYLGKLRKQIGLDFDLPTEVQLEYACRADTTGKFNVDGVDIVKLGKCADNGGRNDHHVKVGSFLPNAWGLYDMYGNVWEWCLDRGPDGYTWMRWTADAKETDTDPKGPAVGASRFHHGGGWHDDASVCHSGRRPCIPASVGNSLIGLRLACPADGHSMELSTDEKLSELKTERAEQKKNYGGYTWSYRVKNGAATLVAEKDGEYSCAVSPTPTGNVSIPPTLNYIKVTSIGRDAFKNCTELTSVTIPEGVTSIERDAFYHCNGLKTVKIPTSMKQIEWGAFNGSSLTSVTIPDGVTHIGVLAFTSCRSLTTVVIPSSVRRIGPGAFLGCGELTSFTMRGERPDAPSDLFKYCDKLKSIHVPANAKSWEGMKDWHGIPLVFDGTKGQLQTTVDGYTWSYRVENSEATIVAEKGGKYFCAVSPAPAGDISIPATLGGVKVTRIGRDALAYCAGLKSATIPSSVRNIDSGAFANCGNLQSIVIPEGVESIKSGAFSWYCGVETVSISSTVTNIEQGAFCDCTKLRSFHVDPANPCYRSINGLLCSKDGSYMVAGVNGDVMIPEGVATIGSDSFHGCFGLNSVLIPSSVTNIEHWALSFLPGLSSVRVDAANPAYKSVDGLLLTKDGRKLVRGVNGKVTIPDGVECIIDAAFSCSRVDSLAIPEGVTNIEHAAFYRCSGMQTVTIPSSVKNIGGAFGRCYDLTSVTMRGERPEAPNDIFMRCGKLKSIHVPANAKSWEGMKEWQGIPLVFDAK